MGVTFLSGHYLINFNTTQSALSSGAQVVFPAPRCRRGRRRITLIPARWWRERVYYVLVSYTYGMIITVNHGEKGNRALVFNSAPSGVTFTASNSVGSNGLSNVAGQRS